MINRRLEDGLPPACAQTEDRGGADDRCEEKERVRSREALRDFARRNSPQRQVNQRRAQDEPEHCAPPRPQRLFRGCELDQVHELVDERGGRSSSTLLEHPSDLGRALDGSLAAVHEALDGYQIRGRRMRTRAFAFERLHRCETRAENVTERLTFRWSSRSRRRAHARGRGWTGWGGEPVDVRRECVRRDAALFPQLLLVVRLWIRRNLDDVLPVVVEEQLRNGHDDFAGLFGLRGRVSGEACQRLLNTGLLLAAPLAYAVNHHLEIFDRANECALELRLPRGRSLHDGIRYSLNRIGKTRHTARLRHRRASSQSARGGSELCRVGGLHPFLRDDCLEA